MLKFEQCATGNGVVVELWSDDEVVAQLVLYPGMSVEEGTKYLSEKYPSVKSHFEKLLLEKYDAL